MSGLGGIVLFRRTFTKVVNQPRLVAGVVAALCVKTRSGVGVPINTIELETFTVTVVELALNDNAENNESEFLRAVLFHDTSDVSPLFVAVFFYFSSGCTIFMCRRSILTRFFFL